MAHSDVVLVMGANPTEAHPVFASRLKRRLRQGARLIVIDPRVIELVDAPHVRADYHLALRPGANVAVLNAMAHVIVSEGLQDEAFIAARCDQAQFARLAGVYPRPAPRARGSWKRPLLCRRSSCARRRGSTPPAATPPSITAWA